ncbi:MAG: hypothetical protein J6R18_08585 [Kiritimatiellae bacterium]|nr:hypothetical protein [Kiritimatiellia bacterium]
MFTTMGQIGGMTVGSLGVIGAGKSNIRLRFGGRRISGGNLMKLSTRLICLIMSVVMFVTALPFSVFAATKQEYVKEVRISTASSESAAKQWLVDNGYQVLDFNLNQKSNGDAVYLGYTTTTDPNEAITDMAVMQMDGGYSFGEYEAMIEQQKKDINFMLDSIASVIEAGRANYRSGYVGAVKACELLNTFVEDDSGKLLGNLIFVENFDKEIMQKVFLQGNSDITTFVYNMLALSCVNIGENNWLSKLDKMNVYDTYDPAVYDDIATRMFPSFEEIHDQLEYYEKHCKEIDDNPEILEGMTDEEIADYIPEDYDMAKFLYVALGQYKYGNGTLRAFFSKDVNQVDTDELYPLFAAMTPAERDASLLVDLTALITMAQNDNESLEQYFESMQKEIAYYEFDGSVSVYANVDRSLFDGGVALTSQALRESAATGESAWYSENNIDRGLSIALGCLAGASLLTAVSTVAISRKLIPYLYVKPTMELAQLDAVYKVMDTLGKRGVNITVNVKDYTVKALKDALPKQIYVENKAVFDQAESALRQTEKNLSKNTFKLKCQRVQRMDKVANTVMFVALGISLLFEAVRIGIKLYNYYHPEYSEIPRIIVDQIVYDDTDKYINYYVTLDQNGQYADLNAWKGQRWNALYTTKDPEAGDPILASGLAAKAKSSAVPTAQSYGVHYFGELGACNVSRYLLKKTAPAIYMFFTRDHSLSTTASVFSQGTVIAFTGIGLLGGIAVGSLGVIGAGKMKKKKDEKAQSEEEQVNA